MVYYEPRILAILEMAGEGSIAEGLLFVPIP